LIVIQERNINDVWDKAKRILQATHNVRDSRVGTVMEYPTPVTTVYLCPTERVLFDPVRNCNPFLHFFEFLWIIAGRNDVKWLVQFNPRMKEFSDDGNVFHGAYGYRLRNWEYPTADGSYSSLDQLPEVVSMLRKSLDERRAVIAIWDPVRDLNKPNCKDVPCNDLVFVKVREGKLTLTVCCRSNDIIWGAYGSNIVCFSMLQEYLAAMVGLPVGPLYQISDSWHAYVNVWKEKASLDIPHEFVDPYHRFNIEPYPMVERFDTWDEELQRWIAQTEHPDLEEQQYTNPLFPKVAQPLYLAWTLYKQNELQRAIAATELCHASDWRLACRQWLERIVERRAQRGQQ